MIPSVFTNSDGAYPQTGLVLSATSCGSANNGALGRGTLFAVGGDGSGFSPTVHSFSSGGSGALISWFDFVGPF
jgi:hypothetical protein